jgi:hypothetical protein
LGSLIEKEEPLSVIRFVLSTNWSDPRTGWDAATYAFDNFTLSGSPLPPGVTLVDGSGLFIGFENQTEIDTWVHEIDLLNVSNAASIVDNPFGSANLIGNKVVKFDKAADASWWQGYRIDFNGVMAVGGESPNMLHVLTYVPGAVFAAETDLASIDIQLCAKDHLGNENTKIYTVWDDEIDKWTDLVLEINAIEYLKEVTVRYDLRSENDSYVNSPANTYYLDAIAFDKSDEPRVVTITGIHSATVENFAVVTSGFGELTVISPESANVEVYNLLGEQVHASLLKGELSIPLNSGLYIAKITSANNEVQISKIIVK